MKVPIGLGLPRFSKSTYLALFAAFSGNSATIASPTQQQSCIDMLPVQAQAHRFSRIVNLGASFTHGCMTCDNGDKTAEFYELTADSFWFRRSILLHFFKERRWQALQNAKMGFYVVENDPTQKPSAVVDPEQVRRDGYSGVWHYEPRYDAAQLLSGREVESLLQKSTLLDEAGTIGGVQWKPDLKIRSSPSHGVLYVAYNGNTGVPFAQGFDLSLDGGKVEDLFRHHGAQDDIVELEKTKWAPSEARTRAVQKAARRILELRPSVVISMDSLFWDAISRTGAIALEKGTGSIVLKFLLNSIRNSPESKSMFDRERANNVRDAYFETLSLVSLGQGAYPGSPVYLARLLENASEVFKQKNYESVIASLLGAYVTQLTGIDMQDRLYKWLKGQAEKADNAQVFETQSTEPEFGPQLSPEERRRVRDALAKLQKSLPSEPTRGRGKDTPNFALRALGTILLSDVLKESPALLEHLSTAFNETNLALRTYLRTHNHNIQLTDADEFYTNFAAYLKPETMHPHFQGAANFGYLLAKALCKKGETP